MNFIESVFSFVFGDGDPNQGIEEERWQMIGRYITSRGGVVAADELAPYLDVPSSKSDTNDESYTLPVLLRFDGQPELDDEVCAGSFFAIPLIRWFSLKRKNNQIENRNKARLQFAKALESPDIALWRKASYGKVY